MIRACEQPERVIGPIWQEACNDTGCVANFAQEVMKGQVTPVCGEITRRGSSTVFGHSETLVLGLDHHLSLLEHVHEFNTSIGRGIRLPALWSCSTMLLKYCTCWITMAVPGSAL